MIDIIPAIDIIGGKAVRLSQGDYSKKKEYGDPLDMALQFEGRGIRRLHLVDLDGAREKKLVNHRILEQIAGKTSLVIDAGGGIRTDEDVHVAFESGASMVTGGSVAVKEPGIFMGWLQRYGAGKIILGADFREGRIAISGWEEGTDLELIPFLDDFMKKGIGQAICTDISLDGMLVGPSIEMYAKIKAELEDLYLVASGGISCMKDIEQLAENNLDAVIVGKAIYENRISLKELESFIIENS